MSENLITEKMKRSVYLDYPDYRDEAFSSNRKFGVYIPKLNDQVSELIERHEAKRIAREKGHHSHNIFAASNSQALSPNLFTNSVRCDGTEDPAVVQPEDQSAFANQQESPTQREPKTSAYRIRRALSRCDSAYSHDTNTKKQKLHGTHYGYYLNHPYGMVGSTLAGSRFYKDHPEMANQGPVASRPTRFAPRGAAASISKFEDQLLTDHRTGEKIGARSINPVMSAIIKEGPSFRQNQTLQNGITKLKETGCLNLPNERIRKTKRVNEKGYVYNDYHSKESNPGYARSLLGRHFV
jgi:hypothetical protein